MEFEERNPIIASLLNANERKDQQIAVLEKALELACNDYITFINNQVGLDYRPLVEMYKQQAEKELGDKE